MLYKVVRLLLGWVVRPEAPWYAYILAALFIAGVLAFVVGLIKLWTVKE